MAALANIRTPLKYGLFPVFKEKNVHLYDLKTWIYLKLNFEGNKNISFKDIIYFGRLNFCDSGVVTFVHKQRKGTETLKQVVESYKCCNNEYLLSVRVKKEIDYQSIENVLTEHFRNKHILQPAERMERRNAESFILLTDRWKPENRVRGVLDGSSFRLAHCLNIQILEYCSQNLLMRLHCDCNFSTKIFVEQLSQKLKGNVLDVVDVKRTVQNNVNEAMCLKEYEISADSVNRKIEEMENKYL